jgi:hypothetical protein
MRIVPIILKPCPLHTKCTIVHRSSWQNCAVSWIPFTYNYALPLDVQKQKHGSSLLHAWIRSLKNYAFNVLLQPMLQA